MHQSKSKAQKMHTFRATQNEESKKAYSPKNQNQSILIFPEKLNVFKSA